ncbi:hypothetical protein M407DRAFT_227334 [Tulasnella calospora MUT 4182]|uniref:DNA replication regulator Sld3 C-terminal domain-containing protein n=1 Tax=Tulasnella calospora MUT 4182 TaxID=1051891 RepID=A0A0C3QEG4_9AGAM|nr:hypothetical protein M407DRAFT_227334 [Tulasnella calospora MUT 4182]
MILGYTETPNNGASDVEMEVVFEPEPCPDSFQWPIALSSSLGTGFPYSGIDPESQAATDYVVRRYLETLWLPETLMRLENLISDLRRLVNLENATHGQTSIPTTATTLLETVLLSKKDIKHKYNSTLPPMVFSHELSSGTEEEQMIAYARNLEKQPPKDAKAWLSRFVQREYQIQILLRFFLLSYGPPPVTSSPTKAKTSPKKRKKGKGDKEKKENPNTEKALWDLVAGLAAAVAGHQETSPFKSPNPLHGDENVGSVEWFCERVLDPLFKAKLPTEYERCLFNLCPSRFEEPRSPTLSPNPTTTSLPVFQEPTRVRSRSPSTLQEDLMRESQERSRSVSTSRELSRAGSATRELTRTSSMSRGLKRERSSSVLSMIGEQRASTGPVMNRGGVAGHSSVRHEITMRKSTKDSLATKAKEKEKAKAKVKTDQAQGTTSAHRPFARSQTMPLKPLELSKSMTLVEETPMPNRVRSVPRELNDSPDALLLGSDEEDDPNWRQDYILDTPVKGSS